VAIFMICQVPLPTNVRSSPSTLKNYLSPEIAITTNHSKEAVDRYNKDYHRVETLWKHGIPNLEQISRLSGLSDIMAQQYIDLLPEKLPGITDPIE